MVSLSIYQSIYLSIYLLSLCNSILETEPVYSHTVVTPKKSKFKDDYDVMDDEGNQHRVRIGTIDYDSLQDRDGRVWSGVLLHNDTTQKILPGIPVLSFLVSACISSLFNQV